MYRRALRNYNCMLCSRQDKTIWHGKTFYSDGICFPSLNCEKCQCILKFLLGCFLSNNLSVTQISNALYIWHVCSSCDMNYYGVKRVIENTDCIVLKGFINATNLVNYTQFSLKYMVLNNFLYIIYNLLELMSQYANKLRVLTFVTL